MIRYILNHSNGQLYTFDDALVEEKINAATSGIVDKTTKVFEFKSTLSSVDLLPEQGEKVGQVYAIKSNDEHDGEEYVWVELQDGTTCWELLGSYMRYYTKQQTYNKDEINKFIKLVSSQIGNISFVETKDERFQDNKEYFVFSQTLGTYIICDVSSGIGELIPPGIYFERNGFTVATKLSAIEEAIEALNRASAQLDQTITSSMSDHKSVSSSTQTFNTLDTSKDDLSLIALYNLVNAMIPVINKLVKLHVTPPQQTE